MNFVKLLFYALRLLLKSLQGVCRLYADEESCRGVEHPFQADVAWDAKAILNSQQTILTDTMCGNWETLLGSPIPYSVAKTNAVNVGRISCPGGRGSQESVSGGVWQPL